MAYSLHIYTIYDHPSDFPNSFVVKRWVDFAGGTPVQDEEFLITSLDLESCRDIMHAKGLYNLGRDNTDDHTIIETWI